MRSRAPEVAAGKSCLNTPELTHREQIAGRSKDIRRVGRQEDTKGILRRREGRGRVRALPRPPSIRDPKPYALRHKPQTQGGEGGRTDGRGAHHQYSTSYISNRNLHQVQRLRV